MSKNLDAGLLRVFYSAKAITKEPTPVAEAILLKLTYKMLPKISAITHQIQAVQTN
ncbi:MAG: hypothetical protein WBA13_13790 [Microcoleaceae cyanobacterium]